MTWFLLQANVPVTAANSSASYLPIAIQLIFAVLFIGVMMGITHWIGPKRKTSDKLENFTSGIESHGDARPAM